MNSLETHVLNLIGEDADDPDVFTDDDTGMAQIRGSLNDAIEEITMLTGCYQRKMYIACMDSKHFYSLDTAYDTFAWVVSAWLGTIKRRLKQVDLHWLNSYNPRWLLNEGTPERYFVIGKDVIGFHPAPASSDNVIELDVVLIPARYTTEDDRIKIRNEFKWAAVHYAVSEYWASRGDAQEAMTHHQTYLEKIGMQKLYPYTQDRRWVMKSEKT